MTSRLPAGINVTNDEASLIVSVLNSAEGRNALNRIRDHALSVGLHYAGTLGENLRGFGWEQAHLVDDAQRGLPQLYARIDTLPGYEMATITELLCYECDLRPRPEKSAIQNIEPNLDAHYSVIGSNYDLRSSQSKHDDYRALLSVGNCPANVDGRDIKVAVVDSGFENPGVLKAFRDVWEPGNWSEKDKIGHGTAMTEIIRDLAPAASVYSVRISEGDRPKLWNAMLGVSAASFEFDADIINLSLGLTPSMHCPSCGGSIADCPHCQKPLPVISNILESFLQGITDVDVGTTGPPMIVAATGNKGVSQLDKPADYSLTLAAGAMNSSYARSAFSNYGASHARFIVMPGGDEDVSQNLTEWIGEGSRGKCFGTSPAAAYASGILALYLSDPKYCNNDRNEFLDDVLNNCQQFQNHKPTEHGKGYLQYIAKP